MRVLILTHGTRGDVQPYAALARALEGAGHEAVLGAPEAYAPVAERHGLRYAPLDDGPNQLLDAPELVRHMTATEGDRNHKRGRASELRGMVRVMRESKPLMARVFRDMATAASDGADLVVYNGNIPGHQVAEWLGVPAVAAGLQPVWAPTRAFPNPILPVRRLPPMLNRASYALTALALRSFAGVIDTWRRDTLRLPRRRGRFDSLRRPDGTPAPLLQAFSRHIVPPPPDYPDNVHTTGYWFLPAEPGWEPSRELTDFLAAGPPPVFLGFSSMPASDPAAVGRLLVEAARRAGVRAVLATGAGGLRLAEESEDVLAVDQIPHDWILPRVSAAVHHGGAGSTAAAGRPHVVCPFHVEQRFWARRARAVGVTPDPIPGRELTAGRLADAIVRAGTEDRIQERARELGERISSEDGTATAVKLLETEWSRRP